LAKIWTKVVAHFWPTLYKCITYYVGRCSKCSEYPGVGFSSESKQWRHLVGCR